MHIWLCLAGTGKSTLIKFIINALNLLPEEVAYITYTGKAASVLRQKGCKTAQTAHKLLYNTFQNKDGTYSYIPKTSLDSGLKIIVVDEVSMLPKEMWNLLLSHKIHVLACGDPFQLPPILEQTNEDNNVLKQPHIFLDEIVRQAKENEIIRLTLDIRENKQFTYGKGKDIIILPKSQLETNMLTWADEIIVATNKKRIEINNVIRTAQGRSKFPEAGDKIICLRNCWNKVDEFSNTALVNGTIGIIETIKNKQIRYPQINFPVHIGIINFSDETGAYFKNINTDYLAFSTGKKTLSPMQEASITRRKKTNGTEPIEFNYGYAITCHKAQGSQWNKVLVYEETFPFDKKEHARWLYTACTRAIDKLILVR